jgi:hypothetical protein
MNRRRGALAGLIAALALAGPGAAEANTKTVGDGNDVASVLDIRSVSHGHAGSRLTHSLRTYASFSARLLRGENVIVFGFDTNNRARSAERFVVVFWAAGRLRAAVVRGNGDLVARAGVSRPSSRSVRVRITRGSLGNPAGYRWVGLTGVGSTVDGAPNRGLILHDITAPRVSFRNQRIPANTTYDVTFSVSDAGGSGLKNWRLQQRGFGTSAWATIASGTSGGSKSVSVVAEEGDDDQYRVIAVDRHGNRRVSPIRTVSLPVDDGSASIAYATSPAGLWTAETGLGGPFLGTLHTTLTSGDSFSYAFVGTFVAIVGPEVCVDGELSIDGGAPVPVTSPCTAGQRRVLFSRTLPAGPHTLNFAFSGSDAGSFSLDGIIAR